MDKTSRQHSEPLNQGLERYIDSSALNKLSSVAVGIAGAGGLGSNVAVHLVRSGIKNLTIADFDLIEPSNLNRQFYFKDQIKKPKVEALAENLKTITSDIRLTAINERLDKSSVARIFGNCGIIVEAFDDPSSKKMLVETFIKTDKFIVAVSGIGGYGDPFSIRPKKIRNNLFIVGDGKTDSCNGIPPMSPRVGIAAAMQADLVLMHILGTRTTGEL